MHGNGCTSKNLVVVQRKHNTQRGTFARSHYSLVRCLDCGHSWRTSRSTRGLRQATFAEAVGPVNN